ncbi:hypothetical protein [Nostoc sp.]|uniref:hypothetical protein n=1 Tax=Nostoc sp. TaxID=1180 RepID=UPI002FFC90FA
MKRNPTLPPNFMLGYAIAAPNLQNYSSQGRRGLVAQLAFCLSHKERGFLPEVLKIKLSDVESR